MTEIRTTSSTGGEKGVKPERYDLIPVEALAKVAQLYGRGAEKYDEHNWRKGYEWSKSYAAMQRHGNAFWAGEDFDPEMQLPHLASVVFHALTLMTFMEEQPQYDNRFKSGKFDGPVESIQAKPEGQMRLHEQREGVPIIFPFDKRGPLSDLPEESYAKEWRNLNLKDKLTILTTAEMERLKALNQVFNGAYNPSN